MHAPILVWFRNDLRLRDHPALAAAAARGQALIPVFLFTPEAEAPWQPGGASRWWLRHALADLDAQLAKKGSRLILRSGKDPLALLRELIAETGATAVFWNRRHDPQGVATDTRVKKALRDQGLDVQGFLGNVLFEPHQIRTLSDGHYKVFTPFYKKILQLGDPAEPLDEPQRLPAPSAWPRGESPGDWNLFPAIPWDAAFPDHWTPTLAAAEDILEDFLEGPAREYPEERDFPGRPGTSRLSPYLHFGQISPRRIWHEGRGAMAVRSGKGIEAFLRQIVWRDFATHLLFHEPHLDRLPMQEKFAAFPWRRREDWLKAWQRGQTGYPIVDAGMRELWTTGWMHNRVRMIVASFLVKDLLIPWQDGARWFWDTLVDANLANNSFGWQWTAGCGADAAPYYRIFNPISQGKKFDPRGDYVRRWVPELAQLPDAVLHAPWEATPMDLLAAGVRLGKTYPHPLVDHAQARELALASLAEL